MRRPAWLRPDPYVVGILASVALAFLLPVSGWAVLPVGLLAKVMVALLFFLYGARLSREAVIAGIAHWRLHALVLGTTFIAFPLVGLLAFGPLNAVLASPLLAAGVLYFCLLPSTIQSSVAFVATARGDVAAAVCTASASNLVGVFVTPLLAAVLLRAQGSGVSLQAVQAILLQLLVPFILGQACRRWLGAWTERHARSLTLYDRSTILMLVYVAFSAAVVRGVWREVALADLAIVAAFCATLLAAALLGLITGARLLGFPLKDEIVIAFCGSQKGLAAGVPMASLLFPAPQVGLILLPVMIYHQFQLIACAVLAQRYARRAGAIPEES